MLITAYCPGCDSESGHEVVAGARGQVLRCTACGHVHRQKKRAEPGPIVVKAIVSHEAGSAVCGIEMLPDDLCSAGDRLVAECGDEAFGVEVTAIECGEKRVERARAKEITAVWTRVIDEVVVRFSVHAGRQTLPLYKVCGGEDFFTIGERYTVKGTQVVISHIKLRDGPLMRKEGWKTPARRIRRVYGNRV